MKRRRQDDRGSALALVPAGFLVLILLAAIAVDSGAAYLAQQQLRDTLSTAASDAVAAALSNSTYYRHGAVEIDPAAVGSVVCVDVAAQAQGDLHDIRLWMSVTPQSVRLEGTAKVDAVFGRVIPGFGQRSISASAQAVVSSGPGAGPAPGRASPTSPPLTALDC